MNPAVSSIGQILSNPKVQKALLWIAIIIIVLIVLGNITDKSRGFFRRLGGAQGEDVYAPIAESRKTQLESMAADVNSGVNEVGISLEGTLDDVLALSDSEFRYLVQYYNKYYDNTMYYDVDWEWMWWTDVDDDVLARIKRQNLKT